MKVIRRSPDAIARAAEAEAEARHEAVRTARRAAYVAEADPLFFKWQRGEATQADYEAAVAAVRARFPYPEDPPLPAPGPAVLPTP